MDILEKKQSDLIKAIRFPLMILVVLIHALPLNPDNYSSIYANVDVYKIISIGISRNLAFIAVPCFFLISGFLFFKGIDSFTKRVYLSKLKTRWHTLLVPYLIWNTIFICVILVKNYIFIKMGSESDDAYNLLHSLNIIELFWTRDLPINYPLWYLRDLVCMVLITPIFYFCYRYLNVFGLLILILINLLGINTNIPGLSMTGLTYFGIGVYLALNKKNIVVEFSRFRYACLIGAVCFAVLAYYFIETSYFILLNRWYIFFGVVTFFNLMSFLIQNNTLKNVLMKLSAPVFFIFCIHAIYIIEVLRGFFSRLTLVHSEWGLIIIYFTMPIIVMSICIILYYFLNRLFPSIMSILLGGRKQVFNSGK